MFGWGSWEGIVNSSANPPDPNAAAKKEALKLIEEKGEGVCLHCGDDIVKNESMASGGWTWESELLLGFCDGPGSKGKHAPKVIWSYEDGVHNA